MRAGAPGVRSVPSTGELRNVSSERPTGPHIIPAVPIRAPVKQSETEGGDLWSGRGRLNLES